MGGALLRLETKELGPQGYLHCCKTLIIQGLPRASIPSVPLQDRAVTWISSFVWAMLTPGVRMEDTGQLALDTPFKHVDAYLNPSIGFQLDPLTS